MPARPFRTEDAAELAEMLDFPGDWLESDRELLAAASLARFAGDPDYGPDSLSDDCARFRHLLGFTDGEDAPKAGAQGIPRESSPPGEPAGGCPDTAAGAPAARPPGRRRRRGDTRRAEDRLADRLAQRSGRAGEPAVHPRAVSRDRAGRGGPDRGGTLPGHPLGRHLPGALRHGRPPRRRGTPHRPRPPPREPSGNEHGRT